LLQIVGTTYLKKHKGKGVSLRMQGCVHMTKNIRIDDDVYTTLKRRCEAEGQTMSEVMRAAMRASSLVHIPSDYVKTLESKIDELKSLFFETAFDNIIKSKKEAPESGFEPESEPRQGWTGTIGPSATHPSGCVSPL
jgi:predicted CopG family antitoxin